MPQHEPPAPPAKGGSAPARSGRWRLRLVSDGSREAAFRETFKFFLIVALRCDRLRPVWRKKIRLLFW